MNKIKNRLITSFVPYATKNLKLLKKPRKPLNLKTIEIGTMIVANNFHNLTC